MLSGPLRDILCTLMRNKKYDIDCHTGLELSRQEDAYPARHQTDNNSSAANLVSLRTLQQLLIESRKLVCLSWLRTNSRPTKLLTCQFSDHLGHVLSTKLAPHAVTLSPPPASLLNQRSAFPQIWKHRQVGCGLRAVTAEVPPTGCHRVPVLWFAMSEWKVGLWHPHMQIAYLPFNLVLCVQLTSTVGMWLI